MTKEERAYNYASTRKATKLQVGEIAKFYNDGYEQAEKDLALTWEDVQLLDHFVLELVREEKEGKDWGDGKEFYTEVLTRFKQFKGAKK